MELRKTSENINRQFDENGNAIDRIDSVNFEVVDGDGVILGRSTVYQGRIRIDMPEVYGTNTIEEGVERLKSIFGIAE